MTPLREYQHEGVRGIYKFRGRCLLADDMGVGKTLQCLEWVRRTPKHRPVVVVCPASVKYVWQSEAAIHFNMRAEVLEGRPKGRTKHLPGEIVILNYDILPHWLKILQRAKPQVVILDECHYISSPSARRTKAVWKLVQGAKSVVGTSGTPMTNRPIELWSVLKAINPTIFPDRVEFAWRYCKPQFYLGRWHYSGATNTKELHRILRKRVMIRRMKKDVLKDLPPKVRQAVPFQLKDLGEYAEAQKDFIGWLRKKNPARANRAAKSEALTKIGYLLRLVAQIKMKWTEKWIADFLKNHPEEKLVAFTMHRFVIERLEERFRGQMLYVDGRVKGRRRHEVCQAFRSNRKWRLLVGNWKAAGVGLNLQVASNVAGLDWPWTPGLLLQGEDRIHRFGQKNKCKIWYLMALGTIEEKQVKLLLKKSKVLEAVLNGKESEEELNIFEELLQEITRSSGK